MSLDPPTTLPTNDLLGGSAPPPTSPAGAFFYHLIWAAIERRGGERGFVFPIGSFTFRRPGLRAVACHLGRPPALQLPSTSDTRADLQSASALR